MLSIPHASRIALPTLSLLVGFAASTARAAEPKIDFVHEVMPILTKHCGECHTGQAKKGGFSMNTRGQLLAGGELGEAAVAGNAAKSLMLQLIRSKDKTERMPPKGPRVSEKEIATLARWIDAKLPWEPGVTLGKSSWEPPLKPRRVTLPPATNGREHPIDRLLDADLAKHKRPVPATVSDAVFLRRATLDATGLLPTPKQRDAFLSSNDKAKRDKLIDQLLGDDIAYADHWLTMWNDLLRNDYTGTGFITGGRKQITTWLYAALRENKPYDQFVRELISPTAASAGFIDGIKWRGEVNSSQTRDIQFAQNISQVFLGINMKCASCHDSFIDRWKLEEAYSLAAIYADKPLEINRCDKPTGKMATPKWIFPQIGDVNAKAPKAQRLKELATLMTHKDNGRFTRTVVNRIWHRLMGRGIVHPVDAMHTQPWNEELLDYLAVRFADDGYDLRKLIRLIMTSQAYQSKTVVLQAEPGEDYVYTGPIARRMTAEQFIDAVWQVTGAHPASPTGKVDRAERDKTAPTRKPDKSLVVTPIVAKWIWLPGKNYAKKTQLQHSLTLKTKPKQALMMATCDNAFDMKINGKAVASSKDWQKPVYLDIAKHLKPGKNTIEVDAEMFGGAAGFIMQTVLIDGEQRVVIATNKQWQSRANRRAKWVPAQESHAHNGGPWRNPLDPKAFSNPANLRPMSTRPVRAALVKNDFLMRSLGRPHRDQVVTTRPAELTTLQAIDLANGEILAGYLKRGAQRWRSETNSREELIRALYRSALSREPDSDEMKVLNEIVTVAPTETTVEDLLWSVLMLPEFQIIR